MEFEWDETKNKNCFAKRGFDFRYVLRGFLDPQRLIKQDRRWDYGEERYQLLGEVEGRVFFVAYTVRKNIIRIISARKANRRETSEYENSTSKN
jgi:hypothetical protein